MEYAIRNSTRLKRRSAIFSPRKRGGQSNILHHQGDPNTTLRDISRQPRVIQTKYPQTNTKQEHKSPPVDPRPGISDARIEASMRPKSATSLSTTHRNVENHVRVRNAVKLPKEKLSPWDNSTYCLDRELLQIRQDSRISAYRESHWATLPRPLSSHCKKGESHESDRKTLSGSFSRCRASKTSGPVVNIRFYRYGHDPDISRLNDDLNVTGIHNTKWNTMTRQRDEEDRAKPAKGPDKSTEFLFAEFYSDSRHRRKFAGAIVDSNIAVIDLETEHFPEVSTVLPQASGRQK